MIQAEYKPLVDVLVAAMEERIHSGEYEIGARLPSEAALAKDLGVSRPLVREILARLRERGLIETLNGRGSFVRPRSSAPMLDAMLRHIELSVGNEYSVDDLYTVRSMIEIECARLAAENASADDLEIIAANAREAVAAEGDPERYTVADIRFHLSIAKASKNALFPALLTPIIEVIVRGIYDSVATFRDGMRGGNQGHRRILAALEARDAEAAAAAMKEHMVYSRSTFPESLFFNAREGSPNA